MERALYYAGLIQARGVVIGVDLGVYWCAEHERGIAGIHGAFGIGLNSSLGFESQRITKLPPGLNVGINGRDSYIVFDPRVEVAFDIEGGRVVYHPATKTEKEQSLESILDFDLTILDSADEHFAAAWDQDTFGIRARVEKYRTIFSELEDAF